MTQWGVSALPFMADHHTACVSSARIDHVDR